MESANPVAGESLTVQRVYDRLLYYRRMSLQRGRNYVFPDQAAIAEYLAVSVRTVKRAIARLVELNAVVVRRTGRRNRYYFPEATGDTTGDKMSPQRGQNVPCLSPLRGQNVPWLLLGINKNNKEDSNNSAAADLFAPLADQDARTALLALDFPEPLIAEYLGMRGPDFALRAATFCAERLRSADAKPIKNRVGFLVAIFKTPQRFGFTLVNGRWELPPPATAPAVIRETPTERVQRQREHIARAGSVRPNWSAAPCPRKP